MNLDYCFSEFNAGWPSAVFDGLAGYSPYEQSSNQYIGSSTGLQDEQVFSMGMPPGQHAPSSSQSGLQDLTDAASDEDVPRQMILALGTPSKGAESLSNMSPSISTPHLQEASSGPSHETKACTCEWQLDDGTPCGQQFNCSSLLTSHVESTHFDNIKATERHGLVCRWNGCDRLTNEKDANFRGFMTKSKLRRHVEIHTGPGMFQSHHVFSGRV